MEDGQNLPVLEGINKLNIWLAYRTNTLNQGNMKGTTLTSESDLRMEPDFQWN